MSLPQARLHRRYHRRRILTAGSSFLLGGFAHVSRARALPPRLLAFHNLHTGEHLSTAYWAAGNYLPDEIRRIAWVLRDHRTNSVHPIDARLLDLLYNLNGQVNTSTPFEVISGYRTPQSNAALAAVSEGVASRSLHMLGMAIDIRVPGVTLPHLRAAAISLQGGGVGYYPRSDFIHLDVGRIRYW
jgi:uncharacterized protein YcbK (DUF882 family)